MTILIFIVSCAFLWLLHETDYLRINLTASPVTNSKRIGSILDQTWDDVYGAWQTAQKEQGERHTLDLSDKNQDFCHELYGAYLAIARLSGKVSDREWQKFLTGGK